MLLVLVADGTHGAVTPESKVAMAHDSTESALNVVVIVETKACVVAPDNIRLNCPLDCDACEASDDGIYVQVDLVGEFDVDTLSSCETVTVVAKGTAGTATSVDAKVNEADVVVLRSATTIG